MTVLLGTLWNSIKQIEAPYMFDWENAIALNTMQGNRPHLGSRGKAHGSSRVAAGTRCIFLSYGGDGHLNLGFVQQSQDSCLVLTDTSGS